MAVRRPKLTAGYAAGLNAMEEILARIEELGHEDCDVEAEASLPPGTLKKLKRRPETMTLFQLGMLVQALDAELLLVIE